MRRLFVLLAVLGLCLPVAAQEAVPADQPTGAISTAADATGDAAIDRRIESILGALDGYGDVRVEVREGIVTFTGEVLDGEAIGRLEELAARVDGVVATQNEVVESTDVALRLDPVLDRFGDRLAGFIAYLPLLLIALLAGGLVIAAGLALARWDRPWRRLAPNAFIAEIYRVILRLLFVVAGIVVALDILNATAILTGLFGAAGIVGLAVGFAVRDTVENFIASVMLSLRQPFRPNDHVDIEGNVGTVIRLTSRATILLDPDGNHLRLPNFFVFKARILNYTRNPRRRFGFALGIDPADDLAEARRIGVETLQGLDFVLVDPPPQAWISEAGDSTVTMEFYGWVEQDRTDFMIARGEALRVVMKTLTHAGIGLPEPSYRLNLTGGALPVVDLPDGRDRAAAITISEDDPSPEPTAPQAADVAAATTITRMVDHERRQPGQDDLLSGPARAE